MSDDVEKHYHDLEQSLRADGFDADSAVMKTVVRLRSALRADGFAFNEEEDLGTEEAEEEVVVPAVPATDEGPEILRALRVQTAHDAEWTAQIFKDLGFQTKVIVHRDNHLVVVSSADITSERTRQALLAYASAARDAKA